MIRSLVLIAAAALTAAVLVALMSRAPASIRADPPGPAPTDPSLGASFTERDIERHDAYRRGAYAYIAAHGLLQLLVLLVLARGPIAALLDRLAAAPGGWPVKTVAVAALVVFVLAVAVAPASFVRGYAMEHAWGLSTQDAMGWLSDQLKSAAVGLVMAAVAAIVYFGLVRALPRWWWVAGWLAFTGLTAFLAFAGPLLIAPLFNEFRPVEDEELARRIRSLAEKAGVTLGDVLVMDAARRTTAENAYVAGLGATKRMVLYDNLVANQPEREITFVAAHELAHEAEGHVWKSVALGSAGLFVGFAVVAALVSRPEVLRWTGASDAADLRTLPVVLALALVAGLALLPAQNAVSRRFEARADAIAVRLTDDPAAAIGAFRRLAFANLADLRPPRFVVWLLYTHPPIPDRIRAMAERSSVP